MESVDNSNVSINLSRDDSEDDAQLFSSEEGSKSSQENSIVEDSLYNDEDEEEETALSNNDEDEEETALSNNDEDEEESEASALEHKENSTSRRSDEYGGRSFTEDSQKSENSSIMEKSNEYARHSFMDQSPTTNQMEKSQEYEISDSVDQSIKSRNSSQMEKSQEYAGHSFSKEQSLKDSKNSSFLNRTRESNSLSSMENSKNSSVFKKEFSGRSISDKSKNSFYEEDVENRTKDFGFTSPTSVGMTSTPKTVYRRVMISDDEEEEDSPTNDRTYLKEEKSTYLVDDSNIEDEISEIFVEDSKKDVPSPPNNTKSLNESNEVVYSSPEVSKKSFQVITLNNSPYEKGSPDVVPKKQSIQIIEEKVPPSKFKLAQADLSFSNSSAANDDDADSEGDPDYSGPDNSPIQSPTKLVREREVTSLKPPNAARLLQIKPEENNEKRLFGGKMTEERLEKVQIITGDVISSMHNSLSTVPEDVITESPNGLLVDLMRHQKSGLTWLLWRETQSPRGGILADDMGLGKTLSMISLILYKKNFRLENKEEAKIADEKMRRREIDDASLISSNATLVIAPATLIYQWDTEIKTRVKSNKLSVYIFHGNKRENDPYRLARYDIVITTFQTVNSELGGRGAKVDLNDDSEDDKKKLGKNKKFNSKSVLAKIAWQRIVLDEAHQIKNRNSMVSKSCCRLIALNRWCLTGTPIHNELWDLFSLIRFLRVRPFNEEKIWKEYIMSSSTMNADRLNTLVKGLLLRRRKDQECSVTKMPLVDLKPRTYEVVSLNLKEAEKRCYEIMFDASKQKVKDLLANSVGGYSIKRQIRAGTPKAVKNPFLGGCRDINTGDRFQAMSSVLVMLLRLRQACVHLALTRQAVDMEAFRDANGAETGTESDLDHIEANLSQMSLDESQILKTLEEKAPKEDIERVFQTNYASTKVEAVLDHLKPVIEAKEKCVIVSQWTSMLDIIEYHIKLQNIKYTSITGAVLTKDRQPRVDSFNQSNGGAQIMLLSLTAGGVGLNLVGGNHLFLIDLHWNPALEHQACDRIYRMGQTKNVYIHKFLCEGTIEKRVMELQDKKTQLSKGVLEGATSKSLTKLTVADLRYLFELDKRPQPLAVDTRSNVQPNNTHSNPQMVCPTPSNRQSSIVKPVAVGSGWKTGAENSQGDFKVPLIPRKD